RLVVLGHVARPDEPFGIEDQRLAAAESRDGLDGVGQSPEALADAPLGQRIPLIRDQVWGRAESGVWPRRRFVVAAAVFGGPHRFEVGRLVLEWIADEQALEALDHREKLA